MNLPAIWDVIRVFSAIHPAYHKLSGHKKSPADSTREKQMVSPSHAVIA